MYTDDSILSETSSVDQKAVNLVASQSVCVNFAALHASLNPRPEFEAALCRLSKGNRASFGASGLTNLLFSEHSHQLWG